MRDAERITELERRVRELEDRLAKLEVLAEPWWRSPGPGIPCTYGPPDSRPVRYDWASGEIVSRPVYRGCGND